MNMNFFVVSARDPTTASCGIILEGTMVLFPFRHVTQKPTAFNLVLSFTLHGWYLGDWTEAHFSPQGQNLQNPGSAWGSKCNLWHFTVFMAPLFYFRKESACGDSPQSRSPPFEMILQKSQSLALFLSSLPPYLHEQEEHDMKPPLSSEWLQPWHTALVEGSVGCWSIFLYCVSKTMSSPQSNWIRPTPLFHAKAESHQHVPEARCLPPT